MSFPVSPVDREVYKNYMWDEASGAWLSIDAEPVGSLLSRPEPEHPKQPTDAQKQTHTK